MVRGEMPDFPPPPENEAARSPGLRAWLCVALLWFVAALNYLDRNMITTMRSSIKADIPMSEAEFGLLTTAVLVTYGLLSPCMGFLADRFSRTGVIVGSLLVWSVLTWLTGRAQTFHELVWLRGLMGASEAAYIPAALALIADHHRGGTRSLATGLHMTGLSAGAAAGGVGGWLATERGWEFAFQLFGGLGVAYAVVLVFGLREPSRSPAAADREWPAASGGNPHFLAVVSRLLRNRAFLLLLVFWSLFGFAGWGIMTWMPTFFDEQFPLDQARAGLIVTGFLGAAMIAGKLAGGWWADTWSRTSARARMWVPAIGLMVAGPALLLLTGATWLAPAVVLLCVIGTGRAFSDANLMPALCEVCDQRWRATGYGVLNLSSTLCGGLAAYFGGQWRDEGVGLPALFFVSAACLMLAGLCMALVRPGGSPGEKAPRPVPPASPATRTGSHS